MEGDIHEGDDRFLAPVAGAIREAFIKEKRALLGDVYRGPGRQDKTSIWLAAARLCRCDLEADPATFVRACFVSSRMDSGPYPNMLSSATAKKWYNSYFARVKSVGGGTKDETPLQTEDRKILEQDIRTARDIMVRINGTYIATADNIVWLRSPICPSPAYVRVLLAYPDTQVKSDCGDEAFKFFAKHPSFERAAEKLGYPMSEILEWLMN
jgi:hypothetical protein